jgi:5-methylcytosine-specific restriction endonuclease McrA
VSDSPNVSRSGKVRNKRLRLLQADPHCWYCGRELSEDTATFDHFIPRSRGGRNALFNGRLACQRCNARKADHLPELIVCPLLRGVGLFVLTFDRKRGHYVHVEEDRRFQL